MQEAGQGTESGEMERREITGDFSGNLAAVLDPSGAASEAYRALRTNLLYAFVDEPPKVILLTSPGPKEGKSTTCANLGVVLAQADKSVLLVDCDLRRPTMHQTFGLRNFRGVVDILVDKRNPQEIWYEFMAGLKIITAGPLPPNPAEILGSRRFTEFLEKMRGEFDYILVDAPPVEAVADPVILAAQADGVLLVLNAQKTRKGTLRQSMRSLQAVGTRVIGTVMNDVTASKGGYGRYQLYTYG